MTERVETVRLTANITNYIAGTEKARLATLKLANDSTARLALQRDAFNKVGLAATGVGVVAGVAVALAIRKFAEFDQAMSNVQAATQETAQNMDLLREAALDAGASTVFTATEAANAIEELGKNGLTTQQILSGGLSGALALASSGQLGVARAAEIASISMKQFGLQGKDIPHIADLLAAGAGKAAGDVEDLSQALNQAGLVAAGTGLTIEETTGILAAFADAGLTGSDAGTSLKTALQRLTPVSAEAQKEMARLHITAYDNGSFIGAANFAGVLKDRLSDLTDEQRNASLAQIFGSDAVRAATVLYQQGAEGIQKYIDQTDDSGYAAKVAADRLDNLRGDIEKLGGAFDTFLIRSGSGANDTLRSVVQSLTFLVDAAGNIPQPMLDAGLAIGVVATAVGLAGGAALLAIPKYRDFVGALDTMGISGGTAARKIALVGAAVGVVALVIGAFVAAQAEASASTDEFAASLDKSTGAITDYTKEIVRKKLSDLDAYKTAKEAGISQDELTDAVVKGGKALKDIQDRLAASHTGIDKLGTVFNGAAFRAEVLNGDLGRLGDQLANSKDRWEETTSATDDNTGALSELEGQAATTGQEIDGLADKIRGFGSATLNVRDAQRQFEAALDDAQAALDANGSTLDINTEAGRENQAALDDIARSALDAAASIYEKTHSEEDAAAAVQAGRDALIAMYEQYGYTREAAAAYADEVGLIPGNIATVVTIVKDQAVLDIAQVMDALRTVPSSVTIGFGTVLKPGFAGGGYTGDIPTHAVAGYVHGREWVSKASTVAIPENRRALEYMQAGGIIRGYRSGGYVVPVESSRYQYAPAGIGGQSGASATTVAAPIQHVTETIYVTLPDGRVLGQAVREYDRSTK